VELPTKSERVRSTRQQLTEEGDDPRRRAVCPHVVGDVLRREGDISLVPRFSLQHFFVLDDLTRHLQKNEAQLDVERESSGFGT